jgi:hypothetical protein
MLTLQSTGPSNLYAGMLSMDERVPWPRLCFTTAFIRPSPEVVSLKDERYRKERTRAERRRVEEVEVESRGNSGIGELKGGGRV